MAYSWSWNVFLASFPFPHILLLAMVNDPVIRFRLMLGRDGDSASIIRTKAFEGGVLALPGTVFLPQGASTDYVRASFSLLEEEEVNEALHRLRVVILKERGLLEGFAEWRTYCRDKQEYTLKAAWFVGKA
jgi:hypothetical protein